MNNAEKNAGCYVSTIGYTKQTAAGLQGVYLVFSECVGSAI